MSNPVQSTEAVTVQERLERLLILWEKEPSVMLFGPGSNVCGKVAGWIRADRASLKARIAELESNELAYEEIIGKKTYQEVADRIRELLEIVEAIPGAPDEMPDEPCSELCGNSWCNDFGCIPEKIRSARALHPKDTTP
jgi:hypothetical protein